MAYTGAGSGWIAGEQRSSTTGTTAWSKRDGLPAGTDLLHGFYTVRSQAIDNAGNLETAAAGVTFGVLVGDTDQNGTRISSTTTTYSGTSARRGRNRR